ncbi:MAG TPA: UDP-2,3-diacylglucosamine diphosphatase [Pseudomonadales bacterium]|nr:UDP-2,3-diacylglucosamine diphosphatase [Pseudomonadales bacterium]
MTTLFISDLHLSEYRPEISRAFFSFLDQHAKHAQKLYILGDFFDFWVGDDYLSHSDSDKLAKKVVAHLAQLSKNNVEVFFMPGNRDFLLGPEFMMLCDMQLLCDPTVITLDNVPTLLMHGDSLCTQDKDYMQFRAMARSENWKNAQLAKPLDERLRFAQHLRQSSQQQNSYKAEDILDVDENEVQRTMLNFGVSQLIHGHTHRPHVHHYTNPDRIRYVLGDWHQQGGWYLQHDHNGLLLKPYTLA